MNKNKLTNKEKLFREKLQDENALNDSWNTPDDELFFSALESIDQDEKRKRGGIYWLSFGILAFLLISIVGFNYWNNNLTQEIAYTEVSSISQKIVNENKTVNELSFKNEEIIENVKDNSMDHLIHETNGSALYSQDEESIVILENGQNERSNQIKGSTIENDQSSNTTERRLEVKKKITGPIAIDIISPVLGSRNIIEARNSISEEEILAENLFTKQEIKNNVISDASKQLNNSSLQTLALEGFEEKEMLFAISQLPVRVKPAEVSITPGISLYAVSGINFSSLQMKPAAPVGYTLEKYESRYIGYHAGIGVNQALNKRWSLNLQLNYTKLNNSSVHKNFQTYDTSNEFTDEYGNELYHTNASIISPTTKFDCELDLDMIEDLTDDEIMEQITSIDQSYSVVGLSVAPQFMLLENRKWNISALAGFELNYIQAFRQEMELEMMHYNEILVRETMMDTDVAKLNRIFGGVNAGLNVQYNWTDRWSSSLYSGAMQSLNSIKENSDGVNTNISDLRISFKTSYSF